MLTRSFSYLLPGLLLGVVAGYLLAVTAVLRSKAGEVLDNLHAVLLSLPDFFIITLLQLLAILLVKIEGHKVLTIMQFGGDVPFAIPLLSS